MKKNIKTLHTLIGVLFCLFAFVLPTITYWKIKTPIVTTIEYQINYLDTSSLTKENVQNYISQINIQHPEIVFAQFILETGGGKSYQAKTYNNLFGMMVPNKRIFVGYSIPFSNYAGYTSWKHSVIDYAIWQATYAKNKTKSEYFQYLGNAYAEDLNYVDKLKTIIKKI